ncbi:hemerythrin domain-containing protein [Phenylobacterium sp.]|uniref:hemerythrin domain-containing protein n=1 Tax=Phenylobacterium sp. TaxID=1871053 RepID=UPI0035AE90B4
MSIIDKALGAITPPESDEKRAEATRKAREAAMPGDWLSMALDHHDEIRAAFEAGRQAQDGPGRVAAMKRLAMVLNGHSLAEEVVLYPALAKAGEKHHAGMAYTEQTTAKMQMAELERIDPVSDAKGWDEKWEHIRGAVLHHIFEEEGTWFLKIREEYDNQTFLTHRFREEYERYAKGVEAEGRPAAEPRSFQDGVSEGPALQ